MAIVIAAYLLLPNSTSLGHDRELCYITCPVLVQHPYKSRYEAEGCCTMNDRYSEVPGLWAIVDWYMRDFGGGHVYSQTVDMLLHSQDKKLSPPGTALWYIKMEAMLVCWK